MAVSNIKRLRIKLPEPGTLYRGMKKFCITKILYGFSTSSAIISNPF